MGAQLKSWEQMGAALFLVKRQERFCVLMWDTASVFDEPVEFSEVCSRRSSGFKKNDDISYKNSNLGLRG